MKSLSTLCLILLVPIGVQAKDMSALYDHATLAYWQTRYPRNIEWNFKNVILPVLTPAERRTLAGVTLRFPLRGEFMSDPLEFSASLNPPAVTIPILSVKFFDDLSIAHAWLSVNDYSPETVTNYVAMLKYNPPARFPGGRYPLPLRALRVPDNATANSRVDELSQKILKSAVVWILAHELGHIYHRHPGYAGVTLKQAQNNEEEADRFATEIMRRIGEPPAGMVMFFTIAAHWWLNRGDFSSDKAWEDYLEKEATHPFTAQRLLALAARLEAAAGDFARSETDYAAGVERARYIAKQVSTIAGILQDTDVQRSILLTARATDLTSLAPRRPGELLATPPQESEPDPKAVLAFHGTYEGEFSSGSARETLRIRMAFHRSREQVTGRYSYGLGEGTISGVVKGDTLDFQWREGGSYGHGMLRATEQGAGFSGTWGSGESRDNGGSWSGRRR